MHTEYLTRPHDVTPKLGWATAIVSLSTLLFGYHLSELNAPGIIISCEFQKPGPGDTFWSGFEQCIPMGNSGIALMNAMYTAGGFSISLLLGSTAISSRYGRRFLSFVAAAMYCLGSFLMATTNTLQMMNVGRFLVGIGAGGAIIISPILINELTPINHRGLLGSLLQVSVACGIFLAQFVSYFWANDEQWRYIFAFALLLGLILFIGLFTVSESPKWIVMSQGDVSYATALLTDLRSDNETVEHEINHWRRLSSASKSENTPLLPVHSEPRRSSFEVSELSTWEYCTKTKYRGELVAVLIIMTSQQLTGINAITFYGVKLLTSLFEGSDQSTVLILAASFSLCNVFSSVVVSNFFERFGRRSLMLASVTGTSLCAFFIGAGLILGNTFIIVSGCYGFIMCYSIGVGPVPFLMVAEFASHETVSLAQSIGTSANWATGILVAFSVPFLQSFIGGGVFFIFGGLSMGYFALVWFMVPETKGYSNSDDVWIDFEK